LIEILIEVDFGITVVPFFYEGSGYENVDSAQLN